MGNIARSEIEAWPIPTPYTGDRQRDFETGWRACADRQGFIADRLRDELRGAVEALERYGRHDHSCRSQRVLGQAPCNCGYEDVRAAVIGSS